MGLTVTGCAKHADFVDLREDVQKLQVTQALQAKRWSEQEERFKGVEAKARGERQASIPAMSASSDLTQTMEPLIARLKILEDRVSRLDDQLAGQALQKSTVPYARSEEGAVESSRQSKPARLPASEQGFSIQGTPGLTPTHAFNLSHNDYLGGRYDLAIDGFRQFLRDYPSTSLTPTVQYLIGSSYYHKKNYQDAIQEFDTLVREHPQSEKVPPALYKMGLAYVEVQDLAKARELFKQVVKDYSDADEAKLAKKKLAELR